MGYGHIHVHLSRYYQRSGPSQGPYMFHHRTFFQDHVQTRQYAAFGLAEPRYYFLELFHSLIAELKRHQGTLQLLDATGSRRDSFQR